MQHLVRRAVEGLVTVVAGGMLVGCSSLTFARGTAAAVPAIIDTTPVRAPWVAPSAAAAPRSDEAATERLVRMAEVWTAARWFHPQAIRNVGAWDTAYLRHVDAARAATDDASFARAVQDMLAELRDAATRVVGDTTNPPRSASVAAALQRTGDGLIIARPVQIAPGNVAGLVASADQGLAPRSTAVLDLRVDSGSVSGGQWWARQLLDGEYPLPDGVLEAPARRRVQHAHPGGRSSDDTAAATSVMRECCTQWLTTSGAVLRAARGRPDAAPDRPTTDTAMARAVAREGTGFVPPLVVVIVNDATIVPSPLFTLHAAGQALFVSTGTGLLRSDAEAVQLAIGGGFHARIRIEELQLANGRVVPALADTVLTGGGASSSLQPDSADRAVQLALELARGTQRLGARSHASSQPDARGATAQHRVDAPYPALSERLLAVTKLWGTVRAFNPYLPMADESWDDMFVRSLGDAEVAASARDYATAMLRYVATLDASQADLDVTDHPEFGANTGYVPFTLRLVDRRPLVVAISDSLAQNTGVRMGDELVAIGGEPIDKRLGRLRELVSASNDWSRDQKLEAWLTAGPAGTIATFRFQAASGASTSREFTYQAPTGAERMNTELLREITSMSNGIVRVRLGSDTARSVTALPSLVAEARGVIVDARGVRDSASLRWLAGSLLDADRRAYARDDRSVITAPPRGALRTPELDPARQFARSERTTPAVSGDAFSGPVAILVDATTSGDGELLVLRLLAGGPNRVLVGSQTAGAVGETAVLSLPGGVRVRIPVSAVRHPDGRFIQRLGLSPNVSVAPTVSGVRSGRDEAMEAAQRWITQQLAPPPARRR